MSLPGVLGDIEAVAGTAAALQLAREHGGMQIRLSPRSGSALVRCVGPEAAAAIVERLGRGHLMVPMANVRGQRGRRAAAAELQAKGASAREAALACDIHTRTAWRARASSKGKTPLFDRED